LFRLEPLAAKCAGLEELSAGVRGAWGKTKSLGRRSRGR
jgi:hypothetical protein